MIIDAPGTWNLFSLCQQLFGTLIISLISNRWPRDLIPLECETETQQEKKSGDCSLSAQGADIWCWRNWSTGVRTVKYIYSCCSMKQNVSCRQTKRDGSVQSSMILQGQDTMSISYNPVKWICLPIKMRTLLCISASSHFTGRLPHTICSKGLGACMVCGIERN